MVPNPGTHCRIYDIEICQQNVFDGFAVIVVVIWWYFLSSCSRPCSAVYLIRWLCAGFLVLLSRWQIIAFARWENKTGLCFCHCRLFPFVHPSMSLIRSCCVAGWYFDTRTHRRLLFILLFIASCCPLSSVPHTRIRPNTRNLLCAHAEQMAKWASKIKWPAMKCVKTKRAETNWRWCANPDRARHDRLNDMS